MKCSLAVFSALTKSWLRSKEGVFFSFLFPVMLLLIFGTVFGGGGGQTYLLHVQNLDLENGRPTWLSSTLIGILENTGTFEIKEIAAGVDVESYVEEHLSFTNYRILVIPENFEQKVMSKGIYVRTGVILDTLNFIVKNYGSEMTSHQVESIENGMDALETWRRHVTTENVEVLLLTSEGDTAAPIISGVISSVVNAFNNEMVGAEEVVGMMENQLTQRGLKAVDYYLPGYIAAFIMTNGIIGVASNTSEFRRRGVIKRLAATSLRKSSWILGNLVHQALLAFALMLLMIALGWAVFGVQAIPDPYALLLIFMGSVVFCTMGITLGGVIKDVEATHAAANAIAFPMMFLSGAFWPVEMMPGFMQEVAKCLPLYHFHDGLRQIMIYQNPAQAAVPFLILGILAVAFIYFAIKTTKWKEF